MTQLILVKAKLQRLILQIRGAVGFGRSNGQQSRCNNLCVLRLIPRESSSVASVGARGRSGGTRGGSSGRRAKHWDRILEITPLQLVLRRNYGRSFTACIHNLAKKPFFSLILFNSCSCSKSSFPSSCALLTSNQVKLCSCQPARNRQSPGQIPSLQSGHTIQI